jgi:hypothetical protein
VPFGAARAQRAREHSVRRSVLTACAISKRATAVVALGIGTIRRASAGDGEQSPRLGDALEFLFAAIVELDARPGHEVLDRLSVPSLQIARHIMANCR